MLIESEDPHRNGIKVNNGYLRPLPDQFPKKAVLQNAWAGSALRPATDVTGSSSSSGSFFKSDFSTAGLLGGRVPIEIKKTTDSGKG